MPRSRGAGRPAGRPVVASRSSPPARVQQAPPPAIPQASGGGSMLGGLASTVAEGMAFGTGSAIAHRAAEAIVGPRTIQHEHVQVNNGAGDTSSDHITTIAQTSCSNQSKAFQDCIQANTDDIGKCQFYLDMLNECRRGSRSLAI